MALKGTELASAYVSLSFSTDKLPQQLRNITRNLKDVEVDVDADTKGATAHMEGWRATQQRRPVKIDVDVDTRRARKEVDALSSNLFKFGRSDFLRLNLGAAAISGLPALAAGLGEVTAAMVQLSQAALAIPGAIAGAASSFGTLALGVSGITDAYDALNAVQDEAATNGKQVAQQQRAQRSASFGLRNALVDHEQAQQDVNRAMRDARRDLQDLNLEMRGGIISEKRAVLEAQRARERLATGDYTDIRDALLDVEEADLRVAETRRRNIRTAEDLTEANQKGIEGSDQVVAANERLIRSEQGVVQAQDAVASAADTSTSAQEKAALAMSKLSPNAQEFVNTLMDLQGPFQSLKFLVQDNMFAGIAGQMSDLAGKSMPMLERGLGGIGKAWNRTFEEILNVAGTDETQSMLERIFGNTEEAQNILTEGIEPLVEGLGTLTEAGTRALPRLAEGFVDVSERFADFITEADEDGRLDQWIDEGITALGQLGETAINIGKIFTGIGDAAEGSLLANLERWTTNWANWVNSIEGQETIQNIFREGKEIFDQWKPVLEDIPGLFMGIYEGSKEWIGAVLEVVAPVTEFLKDHPGLVEAAAKAYLAFKSAQVLGSIATLGGALDGLSGKFGKPGKGGTGLLGKLSMFTAGALLLNDIFDVTLEDFDPEKSSWGHILLGPGFDKLFGNTDRSFGTTGAPGVPAFGPRVQGPGVTQPNNPIAPFDTAPGTNPLNVFSGTPKAGESGRDFAHRSMMPYWQSQGYTVGDHAADQYGEHQNGAVDIMVGSIEEGNRVLQEVLSDPNVYGAIFNNKVYGYGQGSAPRPYSAGNTGDPTQDHVDHVHVWYKPGNSGNIAPPVQRPSGPKLGPPMPSGPAPAPPRQGPPTLDDLLGIPKYDEGGPWPHGTLGINTSGADEFVLNPQDIQWLQSQGIDPATLQHGSGNGTPVAPGPVQGQRGGPPLRTEGYLPAAAANTTPVGQGGLSSFLDLGESAIHGLIDTGAQAASMAVSAAAAAGSFGAGAAAGPAASTGIQMGAEALKRGVSYGYDLAGIWGEALVEQLFPFGAPRWLGSMDPMAFMPQGIPLGGEQKAPGTMGVAKTAVASWAQPGNPAMAGMGNGSQGGQAGLDAARATASYTPAAPAYDQQTAAPAAPQAPAFDIGNPATWLNFGGVFDQGGVLPPQSFGANLSKKPEYIMTQSQFASMAKNASSTAVMSRTGGGDTNNFYATDVEGTIREWEKTKRRQSRRYRGRP